jgi:hypothetical protein
MELAFFEFFHVSFSFAAVIASEDYANTHQSNCQQNQQIEDIIAFTFGT